MSRLLLPTHLRRSGHFDTSGSFRDSHSYMRPCWSSHGFLLGLGPMPCLWRKTKSSEARFGSTVDFCVAHSRACVFDSDVFSDLSCIACILQFLLMRPGRRPHVLHPACSNIHEYRSLSCSFYRLSFVLPVCFRSVLLRLLSC